MSELQFTEVDWSTISGKTPLESFGLFDPLNWTEDEESQPIIRHEALDVEQFSVIYLKVEDGKWFKIQSVEDSNYNYGVRIYSLESAPSIDNGMERFRTEIQTLEGCSITDIGYLSCDGSSSVVQIDFAGRDSIYLVAGELEVTEKGAVPRQPDECVLLFRGKKQFDELKFGESIHFDWEIGATKI